MARTIAFMVFPGFQMLDAIGPLTVFEMPNHGIRPEPYDLRIVSAAGGAVRASNGLDLASERLADVSAMDTLLVVGGQGTDAAGGDADVLAAIREVAGRVRRLGSVCSGAFILAAAGVLDGRRATTHWRRTRQFEARFPDVRLEIERIFVRDGDVWTSAGVTAGIDLALALVADDLGDRMARRVAQELVVYHRRPGGQSQFSALLEICPGEGRFTALLGWMREHIAEPLTVERLAEQAHMSPRNFARAFRAETGVTPAKAVEQLRLEIARERVEQGSAAVEQIARTCGFGDAERMRGAFVRAFGQPPQALRRTGRARLAGQGSGGAVEADAAGVHEARAGEMAEIDPVG